MKYKVEFFDMNGKSMGVIRSFNTALSDQQHFSYWFPNHENRGSLHIAQGFVWDGDKPWIELRAPQNEPAYFYTQEGK